jgi:type III restriction enzyme
MKLKFKNQEFQTHAVNAVADLFTGQNKGGSTFSVVEEVQRTLHNEFGVGNALLIDDATLLENLHTVQRRNRLPLSGELSSHSRVPIEMETGTGKTYVYTKTAFELNKRYGFTKFIIVVPSVAIREGVYKSLQVTHDHFANHYDNVPCRFFIYNSAKLNDVRQFATSGNIEIMIINIDAFKKAENIINQAQDKLNGETAMRYIQDTNPVVIIDEPQSVDNTPKAKEAIASLNPLCVFSYSATLKDKRNMIYRLTPVDAYQMGLVKQICVSSITATSDHNKPYIALKSVSHDNGFRAKLEIDVADKGGEVKRKTITTKQGDDLWLLSGKRDLYEGYVVSGIDCREGDEAVEFSNNEIVKYGRAIGSIDEDIMKREQIRRTIEAHFDKELRLLEKGIKVLSLFFIDKVSNYRDEEGGKRIYARMFEECYNELLDKPKYAELKKRFTGPVESAHNGYFSQDKKGHYKDTKGDTLADDDTYNLIMRDKELLLSFESPLRFIFSHSALKEGWDNPNVFQVCTLLDQKSPFTRRQKIGRGLRLCVDQEGNRIEDRNINVLHVIANESFADFAQKLQQEIEDETGMKFGIVELGMFVGQTYEETRTVEKTVTPQQATELVEALKSSGVIAEDGMTVAPARLESVALPAELEPIKAEVAKMVEKSQQLTVHTVSDISYSYTITEEKTITHEDATAIISHLQEQKLISKDGKIKDTMKAQMAAGTLDLGARFASAEAKSAIINILKKTDAMPPIRDASKEVIVRLKKQVIISPEFAELWNKIKQKTTYRVQIDTDTLVANCIKDLQDMPPIPKARLITQTAQIDIADSGVKHTETMSRMTELEDSYDTLPDILRVITTETLMKRSTVAHIIEQSGRGRDFLNNPQAFTEKALDIIARNRHRLAVGGVSYLKLAGEEYYVQEIFDDQELIANLDRNAVSVRNSVYDHVIYDSSIECKFAAALDKDDDVKMFFKIPKSFKIDTPIGTYNPDWAILFEQNGEQKLYFVLETKGTTDLFSLRGPEQLKIHCGEQHFKALDNGVLFKVAKDWGEVKMSV